MKKLFTTLNAVLVAAALLLSSCSYDDSGLWGEVNKVKGDLASLTERVAALEANLASEVEALTAMVDAVDAKLGEKVVVSGYEKAENGDITVTLSDGKSFVVYAEPEHTAVTVYTEGGVQYWATVGANDAVVPVKDANGNMVPVVPVKEEAVLPQFAKSEDGSKVVVSFDGGLTWTETGAATTEALEKVSIFSGVEIVTTYDMMVGMDVATAAKITLADGSTLTLDLDAAFVDFYGMQYLAGPQFAFASYDGTPVTSQYVPYGTTEIVSIKSSCVVDVMVEKPEGWKVSIYDAREEGETEPFWACDVTAPTKEAIDAGTAVSTGTVKAFAVLNNGKVLVSTVQVAANPVKSVSVTAGTANVEMYSQNGFLYGVLPTAQFDEMTQMMILGYAPYLSQGYTWQDLQGMGMNIGAAYMAYSTSLSQTLAEMLTTELDACGYVFWVLPLDNTGWLPEDAAFDYLVEVAYTNATLNSVSSIDANVTVVADSTTPQFYAALFLASETNIKGYVESTLNYYDCNDEYRNNSVYTGEVSGLKLFNKATLQPNKEYKLCVVPYNPAKESEVDGENIGSYTLEDCFILDFTTAVPSVQNTETVGTPAVSEEKIGVGTLKCTLTHPDGAAITYYKWADAATMASLGTDADKVAYALTGQSTKPSKYQPTPSVYPSQACAAGSTWTLVAVSFDADWTYGTILCKEYTAKVATWNDLIVTISKVTKGEYTDNAANPDYSSNKGCTVEYTVSGGTAAGYRVAQYTDKIYNSTFGGNAEATVTQLMDDPSSTTYFKKADGLSYTSTSTMYAYNGPYHIVVVAYTGEGNDVVFSKPAHVTVEIGAN